MLEWFISEFVLELNCEHPDGCNFVLGALKWWTWFHFRERERLKNLPIGGREIQWHCNLHEHTSWVPIQLESLFRVAVLPLLLFVSSSSSSSSCFCFLYFFFDELTNAHLRRVIWYWNVTAVKRKRELKIKKRWASQLLNWLKSSERWRLKWEGKKERKHAHDVFTVEEMQHASAEATYSCGRRRRRRRRSEWLIENRYLSGILFKM